MTYATAADLIERYGEPELLAVADRGGSGAIDAWTVERALLDADAEIDAYLAARYPLPLASVPPVLARIACDIARYRLWADRASEEVRRRYDDARRFLEFLAKGDVQLGADAPEGSSSIGTMAVAPHRERDWGMLS